MRQSTTTLVDKDDSPDRVHEDSVMLEIKGMYRDSRNYASRGGDQASESSDNQYNFLTQDKRAPLQDYRQILDLEQEYEQFIDSVKYQSRRQSIMVTNEERVDTQPQLSTL